MREEDMFATVLLHHCYNIRTSDLGLIVVPFCISISIVEPLHILHIFVLYRHIFIQAYDFTEPSRRLVSITIHQGTERSNATDRLRTTKEDFTLIFSHAKRDKLSLTCDK